jgi:hypothetical protein
MLWGGEVAWRAERGIAGMSSLPGVTAQAVHGWSEITDLYVNKFGQPPPGSRVFIWTRRVIDGRKDASSKPAPMCPRGRRNRKTVAAR